MRTRSKVFSPKGVAWITWKLVACFGILSGFAESFGSSPHTVPSLDSIRNKYHLPALAGAIFTTDGLIQEEAVGVRKRGTAVPVTAADDWQLGSDSKAMTAMLVAIFINRGKLSWSSRVVSFFPEVVGQVPAANRNITIGDVLSHQAGLKEDLAWFGIARKGTVSQQRQAAAIMALDTPAYAPGTFHYSNADYVLIAAILERVGGKPWEDLMIENLFVPLRMASAGFGRSAHRDKLDQPWPHRTDGNPLPETGYFAGGRETFGETELPTILAPAGLIHCSMGDWARFLSDQLRGGANQPALLPTALYQAMQTAQPNSPSAFGWGVGDQDQAWAGGKILTHAGSDLLNYALCILAPRKHFGVVVCTNQGGDAAARACNEAAGALINSYLASPFAPTNGPSKN